MPRPSNVFFRKNREEERKWSARLTRGYTDGGATICAEHYQKQIFPRAAIHSAVRVFTGEAD